MRYERALADEQPAKASQAPVPVAGDADPTDRSMSLGDRMRSPQTIVSFIVAFAIIAVVFWRLDIDFADVWSQIRNA
ncbi:MAG: hypothetical protein M3439_03885, partial [Chloroflexota bacterium]|nr:hypothetical protein [Chloroflexota bacterium]